METGRRPREGRKERRKEGGRAMKAGERGSHGIGDGVRGGGGGGEAA